MREQPALANAFARSAGLVFDFHIDVHSDFHTDVHFHFDYFLSTAFEIC